MEQTENIVNSYKNNGNIKSILKYGSYEKCKLPKVSIVMPVYKRADMFELALKSALEQTYNEEYEIVVADNYDFGDDSPNLSVVEKISSPKVFYYHNSMNLGMFGNWNRCIELARSENVVYCHDDDLLEPDAIEYLMRLKSANGEECIFSTHNNIDENGKVIFKYGFPRRKLFLKEKEYFRATPLYWMLHSAGCSTGCLYNKKIMLEIGGFNDACYPSADYDLMIRYTVKSGCIISNKPTYNYRVASNESFNVYDKFADADKKIHYSLIKYIKAPKCILEKIIAIRHKENSIKNQVVFGKEKGTSVKLTTAEKLILFVFKSFSERNKYRL